MADSNFKVLKKGKYLLHYSSISRDYESKFYVFDFIPFE